MHDFQYKAGELYGEDVPVCRVAAEAGTPLYLYSRKTLERHYAAFDGAFGGIDHLTCYSVKANSSLAVLSLLAGRGAGVDVVSGGEIFRALKAGVPARKIVYSGVGKTRDEIAYALTSDILMFNVESLQELDTLDRVAAKLGRRAPVALRINPDVDPQTHPYISTGMEKNKFGIRMQDAPAAYADAAARTHIEVIGVDCHIGSQITSISPFVDALKRVRAFVEQLRGSGIPVRFLDIGGGLGIMYDSESPPDPADYARAVMDEVRDLGCTLILEPGRVITGNAGILVTKVLYVKRSGARTFIIVDAAMNDLVRPSLYDAFHAVSPVVQSGRDEIVADIVGPICESGDFIARNRLIPAVEPGELLAVMSAGAYGFSMASNYNSRPRVPEVMVDGQRSLVIRRRETYDDLVRLEEIPGTVPSVQFAGEKKPKSRTPHEGA